MTRRRKWLLALIGIPALAILLLAGLWNWDWFIPMAETRASAALGRKIAFGHLHVRLGRVITVRVDDLVVGNPKGFTGSTKPLAQVRHVTLKFNIFDYLFHHRVVVPMVDLDHPVVNAVATAGNANNYTFPHPAPAKPGKTSPPPEIGKLTIEDGLAHVVDPKLKANLDVAIATKAAAGIVASHGQAQEVAATVKGTYNGQPITGSMAGGALLSLRDTKQPYPMELHLANGNTKVSFSGTVQDPLKFQGSDTRVTLAGDNMADLYKLTGIPIPATPKYRITGLLAYDREAHSIKFTDFHGLVGNTDLSGTIAENPGAILTNGRAKPIVHMKLASKRVDLVDLGGFIGTKAGGKHEAGATPAQRRAVAKSEARSKNLLPDKPFDISKLKAADVYLDYRAAHIQGRSMPLDNLLVKMQIVNGAVRVDPVSFGIGSGRMIGHITLTPEANKLIHAVADVSFDNVNVSRLMAATHVFHGAGLLQGKAKIDALGNSIASWAAHGNGGLDLYMTGGNLSALMVSLSGLEFGNALIASLGLPKQTEVKCFVGDFALNHGILDNRTLLLDTGTAVVSGGGTVNLRSQRIAYHIQSKPKHFSIGSLPAPIEVTGPLKKPSIGPAKKPLIARGGAAAVLGVIAAPLALLPTIQFGVKDPHACEGLVTEAEAQEKENKPGQRVPVGTHKAGPSKAGPSKAGPPKPGPHAKPGAAPGSTKALNEKELSRVRQ